jgi:hypothetical protein
MKDDVSTEDWPTPGSSQEEDSNLLGSKPLTKLTEIDSMFETDSSSCESSMIGTTWYRWPVLLSLSANVTMNSLIYMGLAPVAQAIKDAYDLGSDFWPNTVQMLFPLFSLAMTPVVIYKYRDQQVS